MRTTLVLDDQLFRRAKSEAHAAGSTLSETVNAALRHYLLGRHPSQSSRVKFSMPVFGESAPSHHSPEEIAALRDDGR